MKALSVLHVNTEMTWRGGEAQTLMLARGLAQRGHRSLLAVARGGVLERSARAEGLETFPLPLKGEFDPVSIVRLAGIVRRAGVDLLHYHSSHAITIGTLASFLAGRRPAVLTRRVSFPMKRNPIARLKYTFRIDHLIAVADGIRWIMMAEGIAPDRVSVIHSGIDLSRYDGAEPDRPRLAQELGIAADAFLVGAIGHLAPHKGHAVLLEALAGIAPHLDSLRLIVIGDGEERARLETIAAAGPMAGRTLFAGFRTDVPWILASLDLLVLPSLSGEGSPAVVKEAMASGVPVVASDLDGIREIVEDGTEAILVPAGDAERLARAVQKIAAAPGLRAELTARGRERVREFSMDRMVERTLEIYQQVTERRPARR